LKSILLIIIIYRPKGKAFVFYIPKKSISLNDVLLISVDIPSNLLGIVADSSGIDKCPVNLPIHVSHLFLKKHVVPIQFIVVCVNHLVVVLEKFVLFFQMLCSSLFFVELLL
jgi:hypothetical protein